jgi:Ca2+-binding EF-hand superfamily protein
MATTKRPVQKAEMLNEVTIAEIREIFTLFDKNADGYVATTELGTIIRGLQHNPTERDVADMQRDVDPNQTGSFDQNSLISLIARRPKQVDSMQDMIEALTVVGTESGTERDKPEIKMSVESFRNAMIMYNKENGENLLDHYVEEIINDCKLAHDEQMMIDDFAKYLMSK